MITEKAGGEVMQPVATKALRTDINRTPGLRGKAALKATLLALADEIVANMSTGTTCYHGWLHDAGSGSQR